jgi:putative MFS transporter
MSETERAPRNERRTFHHPVAFWGGVLACTVGVGLHLPMYYGARMMHYRMAGMRPDLPMITGMALILAGLVLSLYGLIPPDSGAIHDQIGKLKVRALDDAKIRWPHIALLIVMALAITIDVMKPTTLSFVAPGVAKEYGLKSAANPHGGLPVSLMPLLGITGTMVGSVVWGSVSDRIGRRSAILFAGIMFVSTSICGAMPGFTWNLAMCFVMGLAAGGMLPIAFTLIAESIPSKHRGWVIVLIGGDIAGAYIVTSWLAGALTPHYSWRILWLLGIPTGLLLIALNRWIPESPRFLIATGRQAAAQAVMQRYGAALVTEGHDEVERDVSTRRSYLELLRAPYGWPTLAIGCVAVSVGLLTYGFQFWVPSNLQQLGLSEVSSSYMLRNSAIYGLPLTAIVAALYGFWSSRKTIVGLSLLTAASVLVFAVAGDNVAHHHALLTAMLVIPLSGIGSVVAVVTAYSSEIYPTRVRARGTGLAAAMTKAGGVAVLALVAASAANPSLTTTSVIGAVPLVLAALIFSRTAPETSQLRLEQIVSSELLAYR